MSSLLKKLGYALETAKDVASAAVNGEELLVSADEKERRMGICRACPHYKVLAGQPRCNECGCFAALKTELKAAKCPCKKW